MRKIHIPYDEQVPLSVQVLSFTCGGFAVVWASNNLVCDGNIGTTIIRLWSKFARTGTIGRGEGPRHDRSTIFRPRDPPTYGTEVAEMFKPWDP